jgi:hypothetical protein
MYHQIIIVIVLFATIITIGLANTFYLVPMRPYGAIDRFVPISDAVNICNGPITCLSTICKLQKQYSPPFISVWNAGNTSSWCGGSALLNGTAFVLELKGRNTGNYIDWKIIQPITPCFSDDACSTAICEIWQRNQTPPLNQPAIVPDTLCKSKW